MNKNWIFLGISIVFLVLILKNIGFTLIINAIKNANATYLAIAFGLNLASILLWNLKWNRLINNIEHVKFSALLPILMAGDFINATTPGIRTGGEAIRAYYLSKLISRTKSECFSTVLMDKITITGVFAIISVLIILIVFIFLEIPMIIAIILESFLLLIALLIISGFLIRRKITTEPNSLVNKVLPKIYEFSLFSFIRRRFKTYLSFEEYAIDRIEKFVNAFKAIAKDQELMEKDIFLAFFVWFLIYVKTYVIFLSIGYNISFMTIIVVITLSTLIGNLLMIPGGIGITEIAMMSLFMAFKVDPGVSASSAVIDRLILYFYAIGIGYICLLYLTIKYKGR